MLILNEVQYCEAVMSGNFTNAFKNILVENRKYYAPLYKMSIGDHRLRQRQKEAIDNLGIENFTSVGFMEYCNEQKIQMTEKNQIMLNSQEVEFSAMELDCLMSLPTDRQRRINLNLMFMFKYLFINRSYVRFPHAFLLLISQYLYKGKTRPEKDIAVDMGFGFHRDKNQFGTSNYYSYRTKKMLEYYNRVVYYKSEPFEKPFTFAYDGDFIYYDVKTEFKHNFDELWIAFQSLRMETGKNIRKITGVDVNKRVRQDDLYRQGIKAIKLYKEKKQKTAAVIVN